MCSLAFEVVKLVEVLWTSVGQCTRGLQGMLSCFLHVCSCVCVKLFSSFMSSAFVFADFLWSPPSWTSKGAAVRHIESENYNPKQKKWTHLQEWTNISLKWRTLKWIHSQDNNPSEVWVEGVPIVQPFSFVRSFQCTCQHLNLHNPNQSENSQSENPQSELMWTLTDQSCQTKHCYSITFKNWEDAQSQNTLKWRTPQL